MKLIRLIVCCVLLLVFACSLVQAATINVPGGFGTIQAAIADASTVDGDEIVVAVGTYFESINFLGKGIKVRSASGNPSDTIIDGMGFYHVVQCINNENSNTVLMGFTIRRGEADGVSFPDDVGGGMYNFKSSPTVVNCIFSDNHAKISGGGPDGHGGGMYNDNSSPTITDCTFELNSSEKSGAGMYNTSSNPTVTNCTFSSNSASLVGGGVGGGMCNYQSNPIVTNSSFIGNSAANGGGMYNSLNGPTVINCIFSGNSATINGGGMYNSQIHSMVTGCTFSGNTATIDGGGMYNYYCSDIITTRCTFINNTASLNGGGMCNHYASSPYASSPIVGQCKFINNTALNGGGMRNEYSSPIVTNCIFSRNLALDGNDGNGAGMSNYDESNPVVVNCTFSANEFVSNPIGGGGMSNERTSSPTVINSIFWGNLPDQVSYDGTSIQHISYSDVQGGIIGNMNVDPFFVSAVNDDLHLQAGSPAIDAGSSFLPGGPLDMDGNDRIIDDPDTLDTGVGGPPTIDMGAYEFGVSMCLCSNGLVGDINCDGFVNLLDLGLLAVHWLETL